ncbi:hypothetical protein SAMN04487981_115160 [Streptomyces sp. cf386]|uniref:DUF6082 family protein n=1 Tax=Streptomyces sp. cf386 TaxID=1761904 RepID=UPI000889C32A|nr:DUF6082 family protein [Streptomyces sp. cf386]SDO99851.1 hypothetical protein SAMN04487981_115160 [Streptomyces sp. cf386]
MATKKNAARRLGSAAAGLMLATAGLTLAARQRRLETERLQVRRLELEELASRRRALAHQQRMHWELLSRAIDHPSLAAVIDTYDPGIPAEKRRQYFYANAWYINLYHLYRAGLLDQEEFYGHARELFQNPLMREYWEASKGQRATLKHSSDEARIGRMVDGLIKDLDEADTEEWWVVGNPPPA